VDGVQQRRSDDPGVSGQSHRRKQEVDLHSHRLAREDKFEITKAKTSLKGALKASELR